MGVTLNGVLVCFAADGRTPAGGGTYGGIGGQASQSLGDVTRSGANGGGPGSDGGDGDHGSLHTNGGSGSGQYYDDHPSPGMKNYTTTYGGDGGSGGDYGDSDGVGFGWDPSTGSRKAGSQQRRTTIHFYGY